MNHDNQVIYDAAAAKLINQDTTVILNRITDEARRKIAADVVEAITAVPMHHAERIADMPTVRQRREAIEKLPVKLQPAVKTRLAALWEARKAMQSN